MQVVRDSASVDESGARVRNTYVTYLVERDSPKKFGLIPRGLIERHLFISKGAICYKMDMRKIRLLVR